MRTLCKSLIVLSIFTAAVAVRAGTEVGNGGDDFSPDHDSAWFLERSTIQACINTSKDFGIDSGLAQKLIVDAFNEWPSYLRAKGLPNEFQKKFADDINFSASCTGNEDLTIYLGVSNAAIEKAKQAFQNPISFSQRTEYDAEAKWGKGFIWVKGSELPAHSGSFPNWSYTYSFRAMMLHEFGHVFGCPHIPGTIMDSEIVSELGSLVIAGHHDDDSYFPIDRYSKLYLCDLCEESFYQIADPNSPSKQVNHGFEILAGRTQVGDLRCDATTSPMKATIVLKCKDKEGELSWTIDYDVQGEFQLVQNDHIFKQYWIDQHGLPNTAYVPSTGGYSTLGSVRGKKFNVYIVRNLPQHWGSNLVISLLIEGKKFDLFRSTKQLSDLRR